MIAAAKQIPIVLALGIALAINPATALAETTPTGVNVLFDSGHQVNASDIFGYQTMVDDLTALGYHFSTDVDGSITGEDLSGNDILVIVRPDQGYSPQEITEIHSFISSGYGVLIMSDSMTASGTSAINILLSPYGLQQSSETTLGGKYTGITDHEVTTGVTQYYQASEGCRFNILSAPAESLVVDNSGYTLVAVAQAEGRIVAVADENSFRTDAYGQYDNSILMRNTFAWLSNSSGPAADFSCQPVSGAMPLDVHFSDQSSGEIAGWHWDFGDGTTSSLQNPSHTYDLAGAYTVSLEVTGTGGSDTSEKTDYIKVTEDMGTVAEVTPPSSLSTSSIKIEPAQMLLNQGTKISINVSNRGNTVESYQASLTINGTLEQSQVVDIAAGATETIVFNLTRTEPGDYVVSVNEHQVEFTVTEDAFSQQSNTMGAPTIAAITLASVAIALTLLFSGRRRRSPDSLQDILDKYRKLMDELQHKP